MFFYMSCYHLSFKIKNKESCYKTIDFLISRTFVLILG
nr:MAG TPA: hypothetical protein [Caudoviricetes sp.]